MSTEKSRTRGNNSPAETIAICGAGMAGLVLAIKLAEQGFETAIFESRSEDAVCHEGEFLTLAPNGMNGLRAIDCCEAVIAEGIDTSGIEILNASGKRLALADQNDHERVFGAPSITIRRGVLAKLLVRKAKDVGVAIHFNRRVTSVNQVEDEVHLRFSDGTHLSASILVAADGLRSNVRKMVFPDYPEPKFTGLIGTGGVVEADVPATNGVMRMTFGNNAFFGYLKNQGHPVYWFNSYSTEAPGDGKVPDPHAYAKHILALHRDDPSPNAKILSTIETIERNYPVFDMPPLPNWSKGRVVLAGDSAHAVGPHAGQGASMAIEDSLVLAACLTEEGYHGPAFSRYEELRRGRVEKVVKLTARNSSQKRTSGKIGLFIRDLVLPFLIPMGIRMGRQLFAYRADLNPLQEQRA